MKTYLEFFHHVWGKGDSRFMHWGEFHEIEKAEPFLALPFIFELIEPLAKVPEKDIEKSLLRELEKIGYRFLIRSSFRSLWEKGFYPLGI
jgi:hypothetical protein